MMRLILNKDKKNLSFDQNTYLIEPKNYTIDYSSFRIPMYNSDNTPVWIDFNKIGTVQTIDNISPKNGNVNLSGRYYTKTQIDEDYLKYPKESSNDNNYRVPLIDPLTKIVNYINLGDIQRLKTYKSPDNTIIITDDLIYLNISTIKSESEHQYQLDILPLDITLDQEYNEITDVIVNGLIIPREFYRINSKSSIVILERLTEIFTNTPETLYICVKGIKFFK